MGAAQPRPVDDSSSSSDSSSGSDEERDYESTKRPATGKAGREARGAPKSQKAVPQQKVEARQETERSSSATSSCETNSVPGSARHLARLAIAPEILRCCCGTCVEVGAKEYLKSAAPKPETRSAPLLPTESQESLTDSPPRNKSRNRGNKGSTANNVAALAALDDDDGTASVGGRSARSDFSVSTAVVAQHRNGPSGDAASLKASLKDFVKSMTKGRDLHMLQSKKGGLKSLGCCITPEVDALLIADRVPQRILLKDIVHVHQGLEAIALDLDYASSLDSNIAVLELTTGSCVSFNLGHPKAAEDFVLYMRLLTTMQRQKARKQGNAGNAQKADDNDDARSECSTSTAVVQKQLSSMPMSSVSADPREAKHMFHMFRTTMKRGKEFYVLKSDGSMQDVECSLSSGHDVFRMRWEFQTRELALRDMLNVLTMQQAASLNLGCTLDERCATVELNTGECITFRFGHTEACDRFVFCMRMLIDQKRERFVSGLDAPVGSSRLSMRSPEKSVPPESARSRTRRESRGGSPAEVDPQVEVETFVRQMVIGCPLSVIGTCGPTEVRCSMDAELRALRLTAPDGSSREVEVGEVKNVYVGNAAEKLGLDGLSLESLCVTLELMSDDCLTFRFPDSQQRDRFALCIRIFANARANGQGA